MLDIPQSEANALFAMRKHRANDDEVSFPSSWGKATIPLVSTDKREAFLLDIS
jgi:hypothetical protein